MSRALVLSGGGFAGGAWMLGLIDGLRAGGVDLAEADLLVGTSAGARTAAQVASMGAGRAAELVLRADLPRLDFPATLDQFTAAAMRIGAEAADRRDAARRLARTGPLGARLVPDAERREVTAALVPATDWPATPLTIAAVDADSGERATFDAASGVDLHDALAATSALPGIVELPTIGGRRYADGGVHSLYNADLAAGHELVVVASPLRPTPFLEATLEREVAALGGAGVHVVVADEESLAAIGPNPLAPETSPAALAAGRRQAASELEALAEAWHGAVSDPP